VSVVDVGIGIEKVLHLLKVSGGDVDDPPPPARTIAGSAARVMWKTPVRLTASMLSHA
jgi:hypothetical protein